MQFKYNPDVDALSLNWGDAEIEESESISAGVILDYDQDGNIVGIEILNASQKIENFSPHLSGEISQAVTLSNKNLNYNR